MLSVERNFRRHVGKVVFVIAASFALTTASFAVRPLNVYAATTATPAFYTVKSGDSLWNISRSNGLTVEQLKLYNGLTGDLIFAGQQLRLTPNDIKYVVKSGDSLWRISKSYNTTVDALKKYNGLSSDLIFVGQTLKIPQGSAQSEGTGSGTGSGSGTSSGSTGSGTSSGSGTGTGGSATYSGKPAPVTSWPSLTYIVQAGDNASTIAKKFGVSVSDLLKFNYMTINDWFSAGQKIAINGYAPRNYAVVPGESAQALRIGKLVDWFLDGQYLLRKNDIFQILDVKTGLRFNVKMLGGYNHSDVEPLTATDTATMKKLFPKWVWDPRPVVIFHDGMNIAASISGMPHSFDSISVNNVTGHFDLYLYNSKGHSPTTSKSYMNQHQTNVLIAAGK